MRSTATLPMLLSLLTAGLFSLAPAAPAQGPGLPDQAAPPQAAPPQEASAQDKKQGAQDRPGPPIPNLPQIGSQPILAVDGQPVAPGRLPAGTSDQAKQWWNALLGANKSKDREGPIAPIKSFDMSFNARVRQKNASNDLDVRFLFLEEGRGYLKAIMTQSNRQSMRGPDGDWLFDKNQWTAIGGREDRESVRELDRWVAISRNFIALTQAKGIRLVELRALQAVPNEANPLRLDFPAGPERLPTAVVLPSKKQLERAQGLRWLEVTSPDFGLYDTGREAAPRTARIFRGTLGLNAAGEVILAQFEELHQGRALPQGALFVEVKEWVPRPSGYVLPRQMWAFRQVAPMRFEANASTDLFLKAKLSRINPVQLSSANFKRPKQPKAQ